MTRDIAAMLATLAAMCLLAFIAMVLLAGCDSCDPFDPPRGSPTLRPVVPRGQALHAVPRSRDPERAREPDEAGIPDGPYPGAPAGDDDFH